MSSRRQCRTVLTALVLAAVALTVGRSWGAVLFNDEFNDTSVDADKWNVRKFTHNDLSYWLSEGGGYLAVHYHPWDADGQSTVYGAGEDAPQYGGTGGVGTYQSFTPGTTGIQYVARLRVNPDTTSHSQNQNAPPPGLDAGLFTYHWNPQNTEIDCELLTNNKNQVWVNAFHDGTVVVPDNQKSPPNYDMTQWHTYTIQWNADNSVEWFIDGQQLSVDNDGPWPARPMYPCLAYWRPGPGWWQAYNSYIPNNFPAGTNADWTMDVDYVRVQEVGAIPEPGTASLLGAGAPIVVLWLLRRPRCVC